MIGKRIIVKSMVVAGCAFTMLATSAAAYAFPMNEPFSKDSVHLSQKEKLGKQIYFDSNLSEPKGQSCSSCHLPRAGFADPDKWMPTSEGAKRGYFGNRNSPTAAYSTLCQEFDYFADLGHAENDKGHYAGGMFWDGRAATPIDQAKGPFLNPIEMNNKDKAMVVNKVKKSKYAMLFDSVYGSDTFNNVDLAYDKIAEAIVTYEQSKEVCKFSSKFDRHLKGREKLSKKEKRGYALFKGKAHCDRCHSDETPSNSGGPLFTDFSFENVGTPKNMRNPFYRMSYNTDGYDYIDKGLGASANIHDSKYDGFMKVPTLRNIELTAPYMHNGVFSSLKQVVHFYNTSKVGNRFTPEVNNDIYSDIGNLGLTDNEEDDIVAFLETLTDK